MKNVLRTVSALVLLPAIQALAQQTKEPTDVLMPEQSSALVWIVGIGLLVCTLIAGFKHPGRSHLD